MGQNVFAHDSVAYRHQHVKEKLAVFLFFGFDVVMVVGSAADPEF